MVRLDFYSDPAHGWYRVRRSALVDYGVAAKVSNCSYQRGDYVYLEEDCDAPLLIRAVEAAGGSVKIVDHPPTRRDSSIRSMEYYMGGVA